MNTKYFILPALLILGFVSCTKETPLKPEQIIEPVVKTMCAKMTECQPEAGLAEGMCFTTIKAALEGKQEISKISATQKQLDGCLADLKAVKCEDLMGSKPPEACDFLK